MRSGVVKVGVRFLRVFLLKLGLWKYAGRKSGGWFEPRLGEEALGERRQVSIGQVEFDALNAVHGEKYNGRSEGLAVAHHDREILEGCEFGATQAQAIGGKRQDHSPEFFARTAQGRDDERAGVKWFAHWDCGAVW